MDSDEEFDLFDPNAWRNGHTQKELEYYEGGRLDRVNLRQSAHVLIALMASAWLSTIYLRGFYGESIEGAFNG